MAVTFDLDKFLAEKGESPEKEFILRGKTYTLPRELPLSAVIKISNDDLKGGVEELLGDQYDDFLAAGVSSDAFNAILTNVYRIKPGESLPSAD